MDDTNLEEAASTPAVEPEVVSEVVVEAPTEVPQEEPTVEVVEPSVYTFTSESQLDEHLAQGHMVAGEPVMVNGKSYIKHTSTEGVTYLR